MKTKSSLQVMAGLIGMIKPLAFVMTAAILMGCAGNLAAIFITVLGGYSLLTVVGIPFGVSLPVLLTVIVVLAVSRGVFRYAEQASNHYIAFKLLARIRHRVFAALRKLAPAKLDGSDKGNLVSIITTDIELLEVFYAHTISPIVIAVITSAAMSVFIGQFHIALGLMALFFYMVTGICIPVVNSKRGRANGQSYRDKFGELNTTVLDNLFGLEELLQYQQEEKRRKEMAKKTDALNEISVKLKHAEAVQRLVADAVVLAAGVAMVVLAGYLVEIGTIGYPQMLIAVIAMMSSFGPTAALSALSNDLNQTLASGNRVLSLLEEVPVVEDIVDKKPGCEGCVVCEDITFCYPDTDLQKEPVLHHFSSEFKENKIYGITGESGCGKSTLLKLLMRFHEPNSGAVTYGGRSVNEVNTESMRAHIAYVTQDTFLFQDTIENNIKIAKEHATRKEVIEAAKKASIHEFIESLPNGYDTCLGERGESVSGGEKQRIGTARAFLHGGRLLLLDEPTSNVDSLNEGILLNSLQREKQNKTIILVSHRRSTMQIVDKVIEM